MIKVPKHTLPQGMVLKLSSSHPLFDTGTIGTPEHFHHYVKRINKEYLISDGQSKLAWIGCKLKGQKSNIMSYRSYKAYNHK